MKSVNDTNKKQAVWNGWFCRILQITASGVAGE
jgi:hypothetical protein